eukprot:5482347-Pyramimonas_sp.AAC.1
MAVGQLDRLWGGRVRFNCCDVAKAGGQLRLAKSSATSSAPATSAAASASTGSAPSSPGTTRRPSC